MSILYTELSWFNGYPYTFPVIPPQLERRAPYPEGTPLPERPKESRSRQAMGLKENCQVWWHYLLVLLQYWRDASSPFTYRGPLQCDSNLLMYVYHHIKCLLCLGKIELQHYSIKSQTPRMSYAQTKYTPSQIMKQRETQAAVVAGFRTLRIGYTNAMTQKQMQRSMRQNNVGETSGRCPDLEYPRTFALGIRTSMLPR